MDRVAEADVDLHGNAGHVDGGREPDADAALIGCAANPADGHVVGAEDDAVGGGNAAHVLQRRHDVVGSAGALSGEIDVLGWPVERFVPEHEEHGALEHETAAVGGTAETEEESLDGVPPEERLKVLAGLPTPSEQSRADRRADVPEWTFRHDRTAST